MKLEDLTQEELDNMLSEKEKMRTALDEYKKENKKFRTERDEYKAQADSTETLRNKAIETEAKLKLQAFGVKDVDRFAKYIDLSKATLDEKGNIAGLDDQIEVIKGDFPEVFDAKRRVGGKADAAANAPAAAPKTTTDLQLEALFGN